MVRKAKTWLTKLIFSAAWPVQADNQLEISVENTVTSMGRWSRGSHRGEERSMQEASDKYSNFWMPYPNFWGLEARLEITQTEFLERFPEALGFGWVSSTARIAFLGYFGIAVSCLRHKQNIWSFSFCSIFFPFSWLVLCLPSSFTNQFQHFHTVEAVVHVEVRAKAGRYPSALAKEQSPSALED